MPSEDWLRDALLAEADHRRAKQEKIFTWTLTVLISITAGVIALKTHPDHPRDLGCYYSTLASAAIIILAGCASYWLEYNWKFEVRALCKLPDDYLNVVYPPTKPPKQKTDQRERPFAPPFGYIHAIVLFTVAAIIALWLPALEPAIQKAEAPNHTSEVVRQGF